MIYTQHIDAVGPPDQFITGSTVGRVPPLDVLCGGNIRKVLEITEGFVSFGDETVRTIRASYAIERELLVVVLGGVSDVQDRWVSGRLGSGEDGEE